MKHRFSYLFSMLLLAGALSLSGCYVQEFVVGNGGQSGETEEVRQWYVLWGLVPITEIDSQDLTDGATDYTIRTEFTALDIIIGIFTGIATVYPKTVTVTR